MVLTLPSYLRVAALRADCDRLVSEVDVSIPVAFERAIGELDDVPANHPGIIDRSLDSGEITADPGWMDRVGRCCGRSSEGCTNEED